MKLQVQTGTVAEVLYIFHEREWHARITGERLTCCGIEFPLFAKHSDEPDLTRGGRCQPCALVLFNIRLR